MTLGELIARFRSASNDKVEPYFWSDKDVTQWLNDAQEEAAIRARLIHESDSASLCEIKTTAGKAVYQLKPQMYEITHASWDEDGTRNYCLLSLTSTEALDKNDRHWRTRPASIPHSVIQTDRSVRIVPAPKSDGTLVIEAYRLPKSLMESQDDEPEINQAHHRHLVSWALYKAFSVPDAEMFDPDRAQIEAAEFARYFGIQTDSDLRRTTRHDVQHHTDAFWV